MGGVAGETTLQGRKREIEALDRLLDDAREGRSGALVLFGEPGIGKTALLEYAVDLAAGFRVVRAAESSRRWSSPSRPCSSCVRR